MKVKGSTIIISVVIAVVFLIIVSVLLVLGGNQSELVDEDCSYDVRKGFPNFQPLFLKTKGSNDGFGFQLPSSSGILTLPTDGPIRLVCPGKDNFFAHKKLHDKDNVKAVCVQDQTFTVRNDEFELPELKCTQKAFAIEKKSGKCHDIYRLLDIGFQFGGRFVTMLQVCFQRKALAPVWSKFDLIMNISGGQKKIPKPEFQLGRSFYKLNNISLYYELAHQRDLFTEILGKDLGGNYINESTFLKVGQLTMWSDFVYGSQMTATFLYINTAPQWSTFKHGNWKTVGKNIRDLASSRQLDLVVYAGVYGAMILQNTNGKAQPLFLYKPRKIPVPAVFWKAVYDPISQLGVVFVGVNNPHTIENKTDLQKMFCSKDVCSMLEWVKWAADDRTKGYGFCCEVDEFRSEVDTLPDFKIVGLLK